MTNIHFSKRRVIPALIVAIGLLATACYLLLPSGYVAIDLNPSIEISTNRLNKVVSVKGANADAKKLLEGYTLTDRDLDDVVEQLVDRMAQQGYLKDAKDNDILITVNSGSASNQTLSRVNQAIASYVDEARIGVRLLEQKLTVDQKLRAQAKLYNISAGRMAVIEKLFAHKDAKTLGDLAAMRVDDLVDYAHKNGISTKELEQAFDDLDDLYENDIFDRVEDQLDRLADQEEKEVKPEWDDLWNKLWDDDNWKDGQSWDQFLNGFNADRHSDWDDIEDYLESKYGARWNEIENSMEAKYGDDWEDRIEDQFENDKDDRDDDYDDDRYDDDDDRYDDDDNDDDHDDDDDDDHDDDNDDDDD